MKHSLIIIDDHTLFSNGIKMMLESEFDVISQIHQAKDILPIINQNVPDVILLDINLHNFDGLKIAQDLKKQFNIQYVRHC